MSLRNRARSLQKKTGLTYQQALTRLRALGDRPAALRRKTRWPLEVCDRYLVDGHAPILVQEGPSFKQPSAQILLRRRSARRARRTAWRSPGTVGTVGESRRCRRR